MDLHDVARMLH